MFASQKNGKQKPWVKYIQDKQKEKAQHNFYNNEGWEDFTLNYYYYYFIAIGTQKVVSYSQLTKFISKDLL